MWALKAISLELKALDNGKTWTDYRIAQHLGISQRSFKSLHDSAEGMRNELHARAYDLAREHLGWTAERYLSEVRIVETVKRRGRRATSPD